MSERRSRIRHSNYIIMFTCHVHHHCDIDGRYRGCLYTLSSIPLELEHARLIAAVDFVRRQWRLLGEGCIISKLYSCASASLVIRSEFEEVQACLEAAPGGTWIGLSHQMVVSTQSFLLSDVVQIPYRLALMQHCNKYHSLEAHCLFLYINHLGPFSYFPLNCHSQ